MKTLVCLLEEPSAKEMLKKILPRILSDNIFVQYIVFEGKQDLEKQLVFKMRHWRKPDSVFLVLRDQDSGDCREIKANLLEKVKQAHRARVSRVRIACRELEAFYLGDLATVAEAFRMDSIKKLHGKVKFRVPDNLGNAAEELAKLTGGQYQKLAGSRSIAARLRLDGSNKSRSFNVLIEGIRKLTA